MCVSHMRVKDYNSNVHKGLLPLEQQRSATRFLFDVRSSPQGQQEAKQHCDTFCGKAAGYVAAKRVAVLPCCYSGDRA